MECTIFSSDNNTSVLFDIHIRQFFLCCLWLLWCKTIRHTSFKSCSICHTNVYVFLFLAFDCYGLKVLSTSLRKLLSMSHQRLWFSWHCGPWEKKLFPKNRQRLRLQHFENRFWSKRQHFFFYNAEHFLCIAVDKKCFNDKEINSARICKFSTNTR